MFNKNEFKNLYGILGMFYMYYLEYGRGYTSLVRFY